MFYRKKYLQTLYIKELLEGRVKDLLKELDALTKKYEETRKDIECLREENGLLRQKLVKLELKQTPDNDMRHVYSLKLLPSVWCNSCVHCHDGENESAYCKKHYMEVCKDFKHK